jgi:hypothetical protein
MATYTDNCIEGKLNEDAVGLTAGNSESISQYRSPDLSSRLMREWPKEMSAIEWEGIKNFFKYIIIKHRKSLQDSISEIKMSFKRSELETQRMNRELLDKFGSKTNECTHVISQVPKETEVEITTDKQKIEKNVELITNGTTEAVAERQELHNEVANVDSVRLLDDRCSDQQINIRRLRKLKKRTQGNCVSSKKLIPVHTRAI